MNGYLAIALVACVGMSAVVTGKHHHHHHDYPSGGGGGGGGGSGGGGSGGGGSGGGGSGGGGSGGGGSTSTTCQINVRTGLDATKPPLILVLGDDGNYTLAEPNVRTYKYSYMDLSGETLLLACPGEGITLQVNGQEMDDAEATCYTSGDSTYFEINGESVAIADVTCSAKVQPYEVITGNSCMGDGSELHVGFVVRDTLHKLITTCHRIEDGYTYYSYHTLDGSHFPYRGSGGSVKSTRPSFAVYNKALFNGFPPAQAYASSNQLEVMVAAMGSEAYSVFDTSDYKYFARGHLSPNADFMLDSWRDATFTYVNCQPQWQQINGGAWEYVEIYNRYNAAATAHKYQVITATEGVLALDDTSLYLASEDRIPIPENYVKLVRDESNNQCIGFVSNNYPLESNPTPKCTDICTEYGWTETKDATDSGYIYCCSYDELIEAFDVLPEVDCSGGIITYEDN